jgi:hypothetical protein
MRVPQRDGSYRETQADDERNDLNEALTPRLLLGRTPNDVPVIFLGYQIIEAVLLCDARRDVHGAALVAPRFASRKELVVDVLPERVFDGERRFR